MSRLTEKNKFDTHYSISISKNLLQNAYDKLGKLEDLEEQLGCPLEVFVKLHTATNVYDKYGNQYKIEEVQGDVVMVDSDFVYFSLKYYKTLFWLKEDKSE